MQTCSYGEIRRYRNPRERFHHLPGGMPGATARRALFFHFFCAYITYDTKHVHHIRVARHIHTNIHTDIAKSQLLIQFKDATSHPTIAPLPPTHMIAHLSGTVLYKDQKHAIIQTGGVGYKISATERDLDMMRVAEHVSVWVHTAVKEDAIDLYGFILRDSKDMFDHLLTISGVGPKTALNILNAAGHEAVQSAVFTGEISYITAVGGVGKKMAEKIVLELKGKIAAIEHIDPVTGEKTLVGAGPGGSGAGTLANGYGDLAGATQSDIDTVEALKSLGYTHREAKTALEKLDAETRAKDIGEKIKVLLRVLG